MKKHAFLAGLLLLFTVEAAALLLFAVWDSDNRQNSVRVNEVVKSVLEDWENLSAGGPCIERDTDSQTDPAYVVLDTEGTVLFQTRSDLSSSVNRAVIHRDTILDLVIDGQTVGKIIINNDSERLFAKRKRTLLLVMLLAMLLQCGLCIGYFFYLKRVMIDPFEKLNGFAQRIAGGNLDIPLSMDRHNLFGAFTESFDIMRSELKRAQLAEAEANASKKELVAKLSHDIKTPVASIKAVSELGAALADGGKDKENYIKIINKAGQIDALVTNLFTATLDELK